MRCDTIATVAPRFRHRNKRSGDRRDDCRSVDHSLQSLQTYHFRTQFQNFIKVKTSSNTISGLYACADAVVQRYQRCGLRDHELTRSWLTHWMAWKM